MDEIVDDPSLLTVMQLKRALTSWGFENDLAQIDSRKKASLVTMYKELIWPLKMQERQKGAATVAAASRIAEKRSGIQHQGNAPKCTRPAEGRAVSQPAQSTTTTPHRRAGKVQSAAQPDNEETDTQIDTTTTKAGPAGRHRAITVTVALGCLVAATYAWRAFALDLPCGPHQLHDAWPPFECVEDVRYQSAPQWAALVRTEQAQWLAQELQRPNESHGCNDVYEACKPVGNLRDHVVNAVVAQMETSATEVDKQAAWEDVIGRLDPYRYQLIGRMLCEVGVTARPHWRCALRQRLAVLGTVFGRAGLLAVVLVVAVSVLWAVTTTVEGYRTRKKQQAADEEGYVSETVRTLLERLKLYGRLVIANEKDEALPPTMSPQERNFGLQLWSEVEERMRSTSLVRVKNEFVNGQTVKVWRYTGVDGVQTQSSAMTAGGYSERDTLYPTL